ncbi:MAG: phosphohistidine phosphatase SixA [Candidatus Binatia bacterium]
MNLYLMRHGIAVPADDPSVVHDGDRPLTRKGIKRTRKAARGMRRLSIPFDVILTSPVLRARQTADIVAGELDAEALVKEISSLAPESTVDQLLFGLTRFQNHEHLLLVGHEPLLSNALAVLLGGQPANSLTFEFKKGALCRVEIDTLSPPLRGKLHWFLTSKQMRLLGGQPAK